MAVPDPARLSGSIREAMQGDFLPGDSFPMNAEDLHGGPQFEGFPRWRDHLACRRSWHNVGKPLYHRSLVTGTGEEDAHGQALRVGYRIGHGTRRWDSGPSSTPTKTRSGGSTLCIKMLPPASTAARWANAWSSRVLAT